MADPTIADLYLAFRQAKTALYYERRGVGLLSLAQYEEDLPSNLEVLRDKLAGGSWFDALDVGEVWVVPKRLNDELPDPPGIVRIGAPSENGDPVLDVQLRLSPSPEFATAELLYLREFGPALESLLSDNAIGYRLDLRNGQLDPYRRWSFEYWPRRYEEFRSVPLNHARTALEKPDQSVVVVSADLASFYDSIDPSFLLSDSFVAALAAASPVDVGAYTQATTSLLAALARFRDRASKRLGLPVTTGIPIGSLTSRVVANVALATLDAHVEAVQSVLCYRRYVDDLVIVAKVEGTVTVGGVLAELLPVVDPDEDVVLLDSEGLDRAGSELQLQQRKVRVHHLQGEPGQDFVDAVLADFDRLVSRSKSFVDSTSLLQDGATHLIRAGEGEGSPLRVLRDADRTKLERFALSTSLKTLERASVLVGADDARELVRKTLERVGRILNAEEDWVANLEAALRLLRLAISTDDWESCRELNDRMERVFGSVDSLKEHLGSLRYRGRVVPAGKTRPWVWLRNYLHGRRLEACASAVRLDVEAAAIEAWLPNGLTDGTRGIKGVALRRRAQELALADLRALDREDDAPADSSITPPGTWMEAALGDQPDLAERFGLIRTFIDACVSLKDPPWVMDPARMYLCTRPPSYFDIARRLLYHTESDKGFQGGVFDDLLAVVNAIRGTRYQDPVGKVVDKHTVFIPWTDGPDDDPFEEPEPKDPVLVLGNLVVPDESWSSATKRDAQAPQGRPVLTVDRLLGLNRVLGRAAYVARRRDELGNLRPTLLVLPELTVPRRWFRTVARHVVRGGGYGAVIGLEYRHIATPPTVLNQAFAVLPGPFGSVATWPWTKKRPARHEGDELKKLGLSYPPVSSDPPPSRAVVQTTWGRFSTLICSELIETRRVSDLLGRAELVLCPAWNPDTSSYDHLIQSVGFQLHAIIAIANNGHYSDCRAWAPLTTRWRRDLCRLIERDVDDIVYCSVPLQSLRTFHRLGGPLAYLVDEVRAEPVRKQWRPLPPDWPLTKGNI